MTLEFKSGLTWYLIVKTQRILGTLDKSCSTKTSGQVMLTKSIPLKSMQSLQVHKKYLSTTELNSITTERTPKCPMCF